jgi:hypothetical protein
MGNPAGEERGSTWDQRVLAQIPSGIDRSQLRENLRLTPTERIHKMVRFQTLAMDMQRARVRGLRIDPARA